MAGDKAPAFQFYPAKFLAGTDHLSLPALGAYIRVLSAMWLHSDDKCSILCATKLLRAVTKLSAHAYRTHWENGVMDPDMPLLRAEGNRLVSNGLRKEALKQAGRSGQATEAANKRWAACDRNAKAMQTVSPLSLSSSLSVQGASSSVPCSESMAIPLPGDRTAMMMLSTDTTEQQKEAMADLLGDVYRDPEGAPIVAAVVKAFNQRMADGPVSHPIAYVRTLVDDIGPRVRRVACQVAEEQAGGAERAQDLREREAENERKRTDPLAFAEAVTTYERRARRFAKHDAPTVERTESAAALCRTLDIEQPPMGWASVGEK